jgi:aspartate/methionine/tyrosine aminotransferase
MRFSSRLDWRFETNKLSRILERKRAGGSSILDLTESNPTRAGLPYAVEETRSALARPAVLDYQPSARGLLPTRRAIAESYGFDEDRLVLTSSTSEAYGWLFKLLCDPGDEILVPRPSYPLFEYLASLESVNVRHYPLRYHEGWWFDLEALAAECTTRTRALVVVHPNNPTGSFVKQLDFERLAAICEAHSCAIISDEVFAEYPLADDPIRMSTLSQQDRVTAFSLGGLSKSCGLPQMKLGWIAVSGPAHASAMERLDLIADTYLSVSAPVQHAAPRWLEFRASFQEVVRKRLRANLALATEALSVEGGWYAILPLPRTRSEEDWVTGLLEECDVLVQPGFFFDFDTEAWAVVSLLTPECVFAEGIERLRGYLHDRA